jgi:hypothetical protein
MKSSSVKSGGSSGGGDSLRLPYRTSASDFLGSDFTRRLETLSPGIAPGTQLASFISEPPLLRTSVSPPHTRPSNLPQNYQSYSPSNTHSTAGSGLGELSNLHAVLQEIKRELGNRSTSPTTISKSVASANSMVWANKSPTKVPEYNGTNGTRESRHSPLLASPTRQSSPSKEPQPHRAFRLLGLLPEPDAADDDVASPHQQADSRLPAPLHRQFQQQLDHAVHEEPPGSSLPHADALRSPTLHDWQQAPSHALEPHALFGAVPAYHVVASPVRDMPRMEQDGMHVSNTPQQYQYTMENNHASAAPLTWQVEQEAPGPLKFSRDALFSPPPASAVPLPDVVPQWHLPTAPHREEPASDPAPFTPQRSAGSFRSDLTDALSRDSRDSEASDQHQPALRFKEQKTPPEPEHDAVQEPAIQDASDIALLAVGSDFDDHLSAMHHQHTDVDLNFGPMDPVGVRLTLEEDYDELIPSEAGRLRFERLIEEELCEALGLPSGRIQVANVERGSVIVKLNIWPDPAGKEQSPSAVADEIVRQCADPHSRIMRGICVRRVRSAIKEGPYIGAMEPMQDIAPSLVRRQSDNQHAEKIAMFKEFEKASAKIPQPQPLSANKGPHFTAPKAALQAHVQRERRHSTTPRSASSSRIEESSLPNITTATDMTVSSPGSILTHTQNLTVGSPWGEHAETPAQKSMHARTSQAPAESLSFSAAVPPTPTAKPEAPKSSARIPTSPSLAPTDISTDVAVLDPNASDDSCVSLSASKFGVKLKHVAQNREPTKTQQASQSVSRSLSSLLAADEASDSPPLSTHAASPAEPPASPKPDDHEPKSDGQPHATEAHAVPTMPHVSEPEQAAPQLAATHAASSVAESVSKLAEPGNEHAESVEVSSLFLVYENRGVCIYTCTYVSNLTYIHTYIHTYRKAWRRRSPPSKHPSKTSIRPHGAFHLSLPSLQPSLSLRVVMNLNPSAP